jgi:hypothetical protein
MHKLIRNYLMDMALFLLLGINIVSLVGTREAPSSGAPIAHTVSSGLLAAACLVHILWHWEWFRAVLKGRIKCKIKLGMNGMVSVMVLLALISGFFHNPHTA